MNPEHLPGIPQDVLDQRIVEAFDQLGIAVRWREG